MNMYDSRDYGWGRMCPQACVPIAEKMEWNRTPAARKAQKQLHRGWGSRVKVAEMEFGDKCIWTEVMEIDHRWFGFTCMPIARAPTACLFGWLDVQVGVWTKKEYWSPTESWPCSLGEKNVLSPLSTWTTSTLYWPNLWSGVKRNITHSQ